MRFGSNRVESFSRFVDEVVSGDSRFARFAELGWRDLDRSFKQLAFVKRCAGTDEGDQALADFVETHDLVGDRAMIRCSPWGMSGGEVTTRAFTDVENTRHDGHGCSSPPAPRRSRRLTD